MKEFLHMGGYAAFVWSAYGIATVVLVASLILPLLENRKIRRRINHMLHEEQE